MEDSKSAAVEKADASSQQGSTLSNFVKSFRQDLDVAEATLPLTFLCGITGFMDAIGFTATSVWVAFQTGNTVQLGIALARTFSPGEEGFGPEGNTFHIQDQLALTSLMCFNLGAACSRFSPWGYKTKAFVVVSSFVQALVTAAAALTCHYSDQSSFGGRGTPSWTSALGFVTLGLISAAMGAQGVVGTKLGSQYATTVVLTSLYCALATEPTLLDPRKWTSVVKARDHKLLAVLLLFLGGMVARALVGQIGAAGTLGIGAGLRILCTLAFCFTKVKKS